MTDSLRDLGRAGMRTTRAVFAAALLAGSASVAPALAAGMGEGCDTIEGREGGQVMCDAGLVCTGPFEGMYGRGNCQKPGDEGSTMKLDYLHG